MVMVALSLLCRFFCNDSIESGVCDEDPSCDAKQHDRPTPQAELLLPGTQMPHLGRMPSLWLVSGYPLLLRLAVNGRHPNDCFRRYRASAQGPLLSSGHVAR